MANILTTNPLQFDTAGATSAVGDDRLVQGFCVVASADTWSCVIHDAASGNIVFQMDSDVTNDRGGWYPLAKPISVSGLYVTTMTDVSLVLVYLAYTS